jgi:riboflavin kinase/FMN adenylyltransferase
MTIGNFDGVHLGHQALFDQVNQRARAIDGTSMVLTFEPHPMRVLTSEKGPPLITLHDQKMALMQEAGVEVVVCLDFTKELAAMEPEEFVRRLLVDRVGVKELVIGYDFRFGRKGRGNRDLLIRLGGQYGFTVHIVSAQKGRNGAVPSSTRIRELVKEGRVEEAPKLLGRYYRITGRVIKGKGRGGPLLGFPTANLHLVDELVPKIGVYAVRVTLEGRQYDGVANIGRNPTFNDVGLSVEVHCFDFQESIYDRVIHVDFIARVRDEVRFPGPDALVEQIQKDCRLARNILADIPPTSGSVDEAEEKTG